MVDLAVERLRTRGTRAAAESLLRRVVPDSADRTVLIVRRLTVDPADPGASRERLAELRRTAMRPHPGTLRLAGGPADAVLFADEAELLACLILDLSTGVAGGRWYWRPRLAARTATRSLVAAMIAGARWLETAFALIGTSAGPGFVAEAVASLTPAERRTVRAAVALASGRVLAALADPPAPCAPQPRLTRSAPPEIAAKASRSEVLRRRGAPTVPAPIQGRSGFATRGHVAPDLPGVALDLSTLPPAPATHVLLAVPAPAAEHADPIPDVVATVTDRTGRPAAPAGAELPAPSPPDWKPAEPEARPASEPAGRAQVVARRAAERPPRRSAASARRPPRHPWFTDGPTTIRTDHLGVLYLLPLLLRLRPADGLPAPSWTELHRFGRRMLRGRPGVRRRAADPLWPLLRSLERDDVARRPSSPPVWWAEARSYLSRNRIEPAALAVPGTVALTRTHLDAILRLDQIDLRIRRAGLDVDPGWVPALGRIIAFHFVDA